MKNKDVFLKNVEIIISDVDGVWTDGGMYYSSDNTELKKFSVYDGGAVLLLRMANIPLVVISGEKNSILENRFKKLKIDDFRLGVKNKLSELDDIIKKYKVNMENTLYIGDFINDFLIMGKVGMPVCPVSACKEIKNISRLILKKRGGEGVLWELTRKLLQHKNIYENVLQKYLKNLEI